MKRQAVLVPALLLLVPSCKGDRVKTEAAGKPNIVFILADDLGYGDTGCYGQKRFSTPHIDRLAAEGMRFTRHYAGSAVSAPSRSSLLTGQHTGHTFIRGNREVEPEGQYPLADEVFTLAESLKEAGYATGAFGKWGLGYPGSEGDPNRQGFDVFFGYNCQRQAHHYYPRHLWHNREKILLEGNRETLAGEYAPGRIHREALAFMEKNSHQPFFLFYPTPLPHAELFAPPAYMEKFRGRLLPEKSYQGVDGGEGYRTGAYGSQPEAHAAFAAMVTLLDDQVGEIVDKLKELGLYGNTVILFSSDNGPHQEGGADPDYFDSNGICRGFKRDLYEGGIRVPLIVAWEGKIAPGTETGHVSAFWDHFPTLAAITGAEMPALCDGISFLPALLGQENQPQHDFLYWEFGERGGSRALLSGNMKIIQSRLSDPAGPVTELFDLSADPGETRNLAAESPAATEEMTGLMDLARFSSSLFPLTIPGKSGER